jgi:hypothetical protein
MTEGFFSIVFNGKVAFGFSFFVNQFHLGTGFSVLTNFNTFSCSKKDVQMFETAHRYNFNFK